MKRLLSILIFASLTLSLSAQNPYPKVFETEELLTLKENAKDKDIQKIKEEGLRKHAGNLKNNLYDSESRYKNYESYLHPRILAKKLKTNPYSQYENPTGIYFEEGETAQLWVNNPENSKIALRITNWDDKDFKQKDYPLHHGYNSFIIENKGNSYLHFFTSEETPTEQVSAHIFSGNINGVFYADRHTNTDWGRILDKAYGPVIDLVGKHVQLAYSVNSLKKYTKNKGVELMQLYDSIVRIQHQIMGLELTNRIPKNRMFGRVIWQGFMHADGIGAAFHDNTMETLAHVENAKKNSWGIAHEFGHVNQVRPDMKWVGTTEVTNNIYSVWTQYLFNPQEPKLEREKLKDYDEDKIGGRITAYMESAFVHGQPWLTQAGPDRWDRERPRDWGGDHFVKLVPLWQLQLYFAVVGEGNDWENKDFYSQIYTKAIDAPLEKGKIDAYYQLEFIKNACDAAQLDLTDFFEYSGLLKPLDLLVDDYTVAQMTITEKAIQNIKQYASQYPQPSTPVLHYLTANSVNIYKNKAGLEGETGKGFHQEDGKIIIDNTQWKNAVAFETYAGEKLIKVAFRGAGSNTVETTTVHTPEGTTSVKAVGWDGKRIEVL